MTRRDLDMRSNMERLRKASPRLDQRLRDTQQRRNLALALMRLRKNADLTQSELAQAMGKDQGFVSRMESTTGPFPSAASIEAYAEACNATAAYVFALDVDHEPELLTVPLGEDIDKDVFQSINVHAEQHKLPG